MIDYETRKQLEEAWLCEMAYEKSYAKKLCLDRGFPLIIHIAKCFLFPNTEYYNHWLKEAVGFCIFADDIRLKPKAKRPNKEFFLDSILNEIETAQDAKGWLDDAILKCPEIERDYSTNEEALIFLDKWEAIRYKLVDYMADEDTYDRSIYYKLIDDILNDREE